MIGIPEKSSPIPGEDFLISEVSLMATVEITISNKTKGKLLVCEKFEISRELAQELMTKMEAMVADLPGHHHASRTIRADGATVVEIQLNHSAPLTISPTYEELFRSEVCDVPPG